MVGLTTALPRYFVAFRWDGASDGSILYAGSALELHTLGRADLVRSKLFALVDRNIDLPDCMALAPSRIELHALLPWLEEQDGNSEWPAYVRTVVAPCCGACL